MTVWNGLVRSNFDYKAAGWRAKPVFRMLNAAFLLAGEELGHVDD